MKLLIIGGTQFLGRGLTEAALKAGHEVTLFNRGKTNPDIYKEVEHLQGDRDKDLDALKGRRWDAVIDTCAYIPRHVRMSAELLADSVEHYTFISTISVYEESLPPNSDEDGPLKTLEDETVEEVTGETYGGLKVLCERDVEKIMPGRVLHVRSGLIVGPYDPTDRFPYWVGRVAAGGEVLAPDKPSFPVQVIDARDQAEWIIRMAEARKAGIYNVTGPDRKLTFGEMLETSKTVSGSDATFTWVGEQFLLDHQVTPFGELPLWVPEANSALLTINIGKALAAGLKFRPLATTIRDTLDWLRARPPYEPRAGMKAEREAELLAAWKAHT